MQPSFSCCCCVLAASPPALPVTLVRDFILVHYYSLKFQLPAGSFSCLRSESRRLPLFASLISLPSHSDGGGAKFGYIGSIGPAHWGSLSPNFTQCARGRSQSPIDISTAEAVFNPALQPLHRDYTVANATLVDNAFNIAVCLFLSNKDCYDTSLEQNRKGNVSSVDISEFR